MRLASRWLAGAVLAMAALSAMAADAEVDAVAVPAWLVRDGTRMPLAPGERLRNGDVLDTGPAGRARLRLADGGTVKLGENAHFTLGGMAIGAADQVFRATLGVVKGAFRYTTAALDRFRGRRAVQVQFVTASVGIRGTDLWGKSLADREIVALIEGRVEVARAGEPPVIMDRPGTWYQAPRSGPALPVQPIADELLARFAQETEMAPDSAAVSQSGRWRLVVLAAADQAQAREAYDRLAAGGYPVALRPVSGRYQVLVDGFDQASTAQALGQRLRAQFGFDQTSVVPR